MSKLSTESYKGVRDFYPEDQFVQNYIFKKMRETSESFGYSEYNASILEPSELYKQKSGEEIVNEQTYTFSDRGDREVTLRPEMTPTVARLVAGKDRELTFPLRWYSIPNLFRYEKPQKGRLREHWQLNVDLFGVDSTNADSEIINIAYSLMKNFGAKEDDFLIRINNRKLLNKLFDKFSLNENQRYKIGKLIDKKNKVSVTDFEQGLTDLVGEKSKDLSELLNKPEKFLDIFSEDGDSIKDIIELLENLERLGIKNTVFDPTLMRGFDYYTGMVFEVFDTNPENNRSLFGGGRYDDLLDIFDKNKIPAVGFGMGDVTAKDFLQTHGLLPEYTSSNKIFICTLDKKYTVNAVDIANSLRKEGVNVSINLTDKKIGDQIRIADKQKTPYVICIGEDEIKTNVYTLKELKTGTETKTDLESIVKIIKKLN